MNMSGTSGKLALVTNQQLLSCGGSSAHVSRAPASATSSAMALPINSRARLPPRRSATPGRPLRARQGCTDTNSNAADLAAGAPAPRNSHTALAPCGAGTPDAGTGGTPDAATGGGDGQPTRLPCTGSFGSAMSATYGRLDGFLVAIVNPNTGSGCRGDDNHIHLQVRVNGGTEDIAVNIASTSGTPCRLPNPERDAGGRRLDRGLAHRPAARLREHPGRPLLELHGGDAIQLTALVDNAVANANHVSIYTTGFDATGGHLIHRQGSNHDGAIVINRRRPIHVSPVPLRNAVILIPIQRPAGRLSTPRSSSWSASSCRCYVGVVMFERMGERGVTSRWLCKDRLGGDACTCSTLFRSKASQAH